MNNYQFEVYERTHNKTLTTFGTINLFSEKKEAKSIGKYME